MKRLLLLVALFVGLAVAGNLWSPGLVVSWSLEDTTLDGSGEGHDGVNAGVDYAAGKLGRCGFWGQSGDRIDVGNSDDLSFADGAGNDLPFSACCWVYRTNTTTTKWIAAKRLATTHREWQLAYYESKLMMILSNPDNSIYIKAVIADPTPAEEWHHLAFTYDGSEAFSGIKIYQDAVLLSTSEEAGGSYVGMTKDTAGVCFGNNYYGGGNAGFNGKIDEFAIWKNRVLTPQEIRRVMMGFAP